MMFDADHNPDGSMKPEAAERLRRALNPEAIEINGGYIDVKGERSITFDAATRDFSDLYPMPIPGMTNRIGKSMEFTVDPPVSLVVMACGLAEGMKPGVGRVTDKVEPHKETPTERMLREREEKKARARVRPQKQIGKY